MPEYNEIVKKLTSHINLAQKLFDVNILFRVFLFFLNRCIKKRILMDLVKLNIN